MTIVQWVLDEAKECIDIDGYNDLDALDEVIDFFYNEIHEKDSNLYLEFAAFDHTMCEIILYAIQKMEEGILGLEGWLENIIPHFMKEYDDKTFLNRFFANNPTGQELIKRFKLFNYQRKAVFINAENTTLEYASHSSWKSTTIPSIEKFSQLYFLGKEATDCYKEMFRGYSNFTVAILHVLVNMRSTASRGRYKFIHIPIRDPKHKLASVSTYVKEHDICALFNSTERRLRSSKSATHINERYKFGAEIARKRDFEFDEAMPDGQIIREAKESSEYEHKFHHSEQALYEFIESDDAIEFLMNELKAQGVKPGDKAYAVILDVFTSQQSCQACELSALGIQSKEYRSFLKKFEEKLKESGLLIPTRERTKFGERVRGRAYGAREKATGIKIALRETFIRPYNDKRRIERKERNRLIEWGKILAPVPRELMRRNIKTETPIVLMSQKRPSHDSDVSMPLNSFSLFSSRKIEGENQERFLGSISKRLKLS